MSTLLLKNINCKAQKVDKETGEGQRGQSYRLQIQEPKGLETIDRSHEREKKTRHLHLPSIYQTENLVEKKTRRGGVFGEEVDMMEKGRKTFRRHLQNKVQTQKVKDKENVGSRAHTEERQNQKNEQKKIYHNFINKKKDKKTSHMRKIIEKVVSEDIEPWNLEPSRVRNKYRPNFKFSAMEGRISEGVEWEREALGCWNYRLEPY